MPYLFRYFRAVALYGENCQSKIGLLQVLRRIQMLEGLGRPKTSKYSFLQVDVSLYQSLLKLLNTFDGMEYVRRDLFICFGLWHASLYSYVAAWQAFR
jgi:hypothetical protein